MTVYLDPGSVLVAAVSSAISIVATFIITWYFSKRYHTRGSSPRPTTTNDVQMQENKYAFWLLAIIFGGMFLVIIIPFALIALI